MLQPQTSNSSYLVKENATCFFSFLYRSQVSSEIIAYKVQIASKLNIKIYQGFTQVLLEINMRTKVRVNLVKQNVIWKNKNAGRKRESERSFLRHASKGCEL